jgi:hypothetical protein
MNSINIASSEKVRGALVLVVLFLPILLVSGLVIRDVKQNIDDVAELVAQRGKLQSILAYGASIQPVAVPEGHSKLFLAPQARALQAADLQSKLRDLALQSGLQIQSAAEITGRANESELAGIKIHMEMVGTSAALMTFVSAAERTEPWMFFKALQIQSGDQLGIQAATEPYLTVSADLWSALPPETNAGLRQ